MLLEIAIGDAYGAGFEYVSPEIVQEHNNLNAYRQHPKHKSLKAGRYTDDTQMTLAIAELLLSGQPYRYEWTSSLLADKFVEVFKRDPRTGYSSRLYYILTRVKTGEEFVAKITAKSERSGSAMRVSPIGLIPDKEEVVRLAAMQAIITHNTPGGIAAAKAAALMTHYCAYDIGPKAFLGEWMDIECPRPDNIPWARRWEGEAGEKGLDCVHAAMTAVIASTSLSKALQRAVAFTGDVDTVAAIAMGAASVSKEFAKDLPQHLTDGLENDKYGKDYLVELDSRLHARYAI